MVVRRAGHLFEEPGTLERVAQLSGDWLARHFGEARPPAAPRRARGRRAGAGQVPPRRGVPGPARRGAPPPRPSAPGRRRRTRTRPRRTAAPRRGRRPRPPPRGASSRSRPLRPALRRRPVAAPRLGPSERRPPSSRPSRARRRRARPSCRGGRRSAPLVEDPSSASAFACACPIAGQIAFTEAFGRAQIDAPGAGRDCPDPVLGLEWVPDLAHCESIERQRKTACDLGRHDYAAAGEPDDDGVAELHPLESRREMAARIEAIPKERAHGADRARARRARASGETPDSSVGTTDLDAPFASRNPYFTAARIRVHDDAARVRTSDDRVPHEEDVPMTRSLLFLHARPGHGSEFCAFSSASACSRSRPSSPVPRDRGGRRGRRPRRDPDRRLRASTELFERWRAGPVPGQLLDQIEGLLSAPPVARVYHVAEAVR